MRRVLAGLITVFCQSYISVHPEVILIDPVESVMRLQNRRQLYEYVSQSDIISCCEYFVAARRRYGTSLVLCRFSLFKECQRLHHMLIKLTQQGIGYTRQPRVEAALLENVQSRKPANRGHTGCYLFTVSNSGLLCMQCKHVTDTASVTDTLVVLIVSFGRIRPFCSFNLYAEHHIVPLRHHE